uniref:Uncharacterized protein LOC111100913 isoform X2 n=1 Tax=Crassostrea virginica TaxID=6565 RepID=A0A8B8ABE8_CRAVI|nr:uncharacterized protein LOC111100913 isoform X2 [Crassostrea virginica]
MKVPSLSVVVFFIHFLSFGWPCSEEVPGVIDNAFLKCSTNESCAVECYPGYVFPNGETKRIYSCKDGVWTPMTSACKHIPLLYIQYAVIWNFHNIIPNECANITVRLNNSKSTLEEDFLKPCDTLNLNFTVRFTFETLTFTVKTIFSSEYNIYTRKDVDLCFEVIKIAFQNLNISKVFDNIRCENETADYTLSGDVEIRNEYVKCPQGMELKNIAGNAFVTETGNYYCDIPDTTVVTTITDSKETKDSNGISTVDTTIYPVTNVGNGTTPHHTDILETTDTMLTNSEKITQLYKITTDSTTFDDNDERTASYSVENTYDRVTDRFTTDVQTEVYIGASAGGVVFVVLVVIIAVVCRKKRTRRPGGHLKALEMDVCNNSDDSFKGELIENTLYQSADGFDNKGASMHSSISDKPYIPLANSIETLEPDLNTGEDHTSNQTDETKLSNCINKNMDNESNSAPIEDDCTKLSHILNSGDEYAVISKSDKNT